MGVTKRNTLAKAIHRSETHRPFLARFRAHGATGRETELLVPLFSCARTWFDSLASIPRMFGLAADGGVTGA